MSNDYETRALTYGFAREDELKQAMGNENTVVVDVRSEEEIEATGKWGTYRKWLQTPCTPDECALLSMNSDEILPDKEVPIIVYCKSGRRASRAKQILQDKGYKYVLNAGGLDDLQNMQF